MEERERSWGVGLAINMALLTELEANVFDLAEVVWLVDGNPIG